MWQGHPERRADHAHKTVHPSPWPLSLTPGQVRFQVREGKGDRGKGMVRPHGGGGGGERNLPLLSLREYQ